MRAYTLLCNIAFLQATYLHILIKCNGIKVRNITTLQLSNIEENRQSFVSVIAYISTFNTVDLNKNEVKNCRNRRNFPPENAPV